MHRPTVGFQGKAFMSEVPLHPASERRGNTLKGFAGVPRLQENATSESAPDSTPAFCQISIRVLTKSRVESKSRVWSKSGVQSTSWYSITGVSHLQESALTQDPAVAYAWGPRGVLGGWAFSYGRSTPVLLQKH